MTHTLCNNDRNACVIMNKHKWLMGLSRLCYLSSSSQGVCLILLADLCHEYFQSLIIFQSRYSSTGFVGTLLTNEWGSINDYTRTLLTSELSRCGSDKLIEGYAAQAQ